MEKKYLQNRFLNKRSKIKKTISSKTEKSFIPFISRNLEQIIYCQNNNIIKYNIKNEKEEIFKFSEKIIKLEFSKENDFIYYLSEEENFKIKIFDFEKKEKKIILEEEEEISNFCLSKNQDEIFYSFFDLDILKKFDLKKKK